MKNKSVWNKIRTTVEYDAVFSQLMESINQNPLIDLFSVEKLASIKYEKIMKEIQNLPTPFDKVKYISKEVIIDKDYLGTFADINDIDYKIKIDIDYHVNIVVGKMITKDVNYIIDNDAEQSILKEYSEIYNKTAENVIVDSYIKHLPEERAIYLREKINERKVYSGFFNFKLLEIKWKALLTSNELIEAEQNKILRKLRDKDIVGTSLPKTPIQEIYNLINPKTNYDEFQKIIDDGTGIIDFGDGYSSYECYHFIKTIGECKNKKYSENLKYLCKSKKTITLKQGINALKPYLSNNDDHILTNEHQLRIDKIKSLLKNNSKL